MAPTLHRRFRDRPAEGCCNTYAVPAQARRARWTLTAAGVPPDDTTLLTGQRAHDVRTELVGGFAGPVSADAPFGKYAGPPRRRSQAAGGWSGDPDRGGRARSATST